MARDHYVPRLYLRGFIDPSSQVYPDPYLWVVDLQDKTVRKRSPDNVAKITGFYNWEKVDNLPAIEKMYGEIENRTAPIISKLREYERNGIQLTLDEKYILSYFLGIQLTRDPRFRGNFSDKLTVTATDTTRDRLEELIDEVKFKEHFGSRDKEEIRAAIGETFVIPELDVVLSGTLLLAPELAKNIFLMEWLFLIPETNFLTTDQPAALFTKDGKPPTNFKSEVTMYFPVSPSLLLSVQSERPPEDIGYIRSEHTDMVNRKMLSVSDRYIFCSNEQLGKWTLQQIPLSPDDVKGGSLVIYRVE